MAAKIKFEDGKEQHFPSLAEAANAFEAMYADYPEVIVLCGVPRPHFREGPKGTIHLSDSRGDIEMSSDGSFYLGASLYESRFVRGMGYMAPMLDARTDDLIDEIPEGSIEGDYLHARAWADPVRIGSLIVEQAEISRVVRETRRLPTHVHHMDFSGSVMYCQEVVWGDVPQMISMEVA